MKKLTTLFLFSLLLALAAQAQEKKIIERLSIDTRGDYQRTFDGAGTIDGKSGFEGRNLNLILSGNIANRFSYFYRQRFNRASLNQNFFNATDRLYLDFHATDQLTLRAGKQTIAIGGYEYDRSSIDLYSYSEYLNNVSCYAWGAAVLYDPTPQDEVAFQVCESMFDFLYGRPNTYSYNLIWYGNHGLWGTMWSANLTEYAKNHYITYIALGNRFQLADRLNLEVDLMNRAASRQAFFFKDYTLIGQLNYQPISQLNLFAKATYDVNRTDTAADLLVHAGTEITTIGAGCEYFPLNDDRIRLHANYTYATGTNTNPNGVLQDRMSTVDLGVTWRLHIFQ